MTRGVLVTAAASALLLGSSAGDQRASLQATAALYLTNIGKIARIAGRDTTYDYYARLLDDADQLADPSVPPGYTDAQWQATIRQTAALDNSLAVQLLQGSYVEMRSVRGLGESFVRSSRDGTMQPVAVYVPESYNADAAAPLILLLHGRPQSETQVLAPPYIAALANQTNAIVIAPWGRGYYDFRASSSDVYDALDAAKRAFTIDPRREYLAGYSMGGFSVFEVAPDRPNEWAAVMSIAGALLGSDATRILSLMSKTPFYVLTGSADESIPTQYPTMTAAFLQGSGLPVSFYSQTGGNHRLITLLPILTTAWSDMLHGVVRAPPPTHGLVTLPRSAPVFSLRP
jgi:dienelactone hydrolase